jgi:hypothetical protein
MITLITKQPDVRGNAILYGFDELPGGDQVFLVESDFGDKMRFSSKELDECYRLGRKTEYDRWKFDRMRLVEEIPF